MVVAVVWFFRSIRTGHPDPAALYHRMIALQNAMRDYKLEYETFPAGKYAEVVAKLAGDNPRHLKFLGVEKFHLNRDGLYSDTWGTPFQIDISNDTVVVSSAGPDKVFGTADDVVLDSANLNNRR